MLNVLNKHFKMNCLEMCFVILLPPWNPSHIHGLAHPNVVQEPSRQFLPRGNKELSTNFKIFNKTQRFPPQPGSPSVTYLLRLFHTSSP